MKSSATSCVAMLVVAVLVSCSEGDPERVSAPQGPRARLLGAVPPAVAERGVYLFEPSAPDDLLPGSLAGPDLAVLLQGAELVVESAVPPLVLAAGVPADAELPEGAEMVDGILVAGAESSEVRAARERLQDGVAPEGALAELAAGEEAVGWAGPASVASSQAGDLGDVVIALARRRFSARVEAPDPERSIQAIGGALALDPVPSSPGKTWDALLTQQDLGVQGDAIVIGARPKGFPGLLLRQLLDTRSLAFLASG